MNFESIQCPHCGNQLAYSLSLKGGVVKCRVCKKDFIWNDTKEPTSEDAPTPQSAPQPAPLSATQPTPQLAPRKVSIQVPHLENQFKQQPEKRIESPQMSAIKTSSEQPSTPRKTFGMPIALVIMTIIGAIAYCLSTRYQLILGDDATYRLNCHTGKIAIVQKNGSLVYVQAPEKEPEHNIRPLVQAEEDNVNGRGGTSIDKTEFFGSLYNGNEDIVVTEFILEMEYKNGNGKVITKKYKCKTHVPPLAVGHFSCNIIQVNSDYEYSSWNTTNMKGYDGIK